MSQMSDAVCDALDGVMCKLKSHTLTPGESQLILSRIESLRCSILQQCSVEEIAIDIMVNNNE